MTQDEQKLYIDALRRQAATLSNKLEEAMKFIKMQAESECYVMCSCQDDAIKTLKIVDNIL